VDILFKKTVSFIRDLFGTGESIPLHQPSFIGNEKKYLENCIESSYVSSVGEFVTSFEKSIADYCGTKYAVVTVNGTSALHIALLLAGVKPGDEVITQPLTFIATINPITYCGAKPVFLDVDKCTLGLSPEKVEGFLEKECCRKGGVLVNRNSGRRIAACLQMHTFGHPGKMDLLKNICDNNGIELVEDAAESMGSIYGKKHTGTFGKCGTLSFNGNKIITSGGGGAIITNDEEFARKAKHLTTQAKINHKWEFRHDEIGYNYRMPNINAALGLAQLENIEVFLAGKRKLAGLYDAFFCNSGIEFFREPEGAASNYWLNSIILKDKEQRDLFLKISNNNGILTRPAWCLINQLEMYRNCQTAELEYSINISERLVNIPSSYSINY
jgi:perosamine synthetase